MNRRLARFLAGLYPRNWRERFGEEFEALLQDTRGDWRKSANIVWSALYEHVLSIWNWRFAMDSCPATVGALAKLPSAFAPMIMSLIALAVVLGSILLFGVVHEADEGAAAHIWQLLMAGQIPLLAFFLIKWLPRTPRLVLDVLALQVGAWLASAAPIFFLGL
jgi:hypothetical protein